MKKHACFIEFAQYVSLNILGMIGLSCYILADTFFVSNSLGTNGLAALNLAIPVYSVIHGCGLMLGMGGATAYSVFQGRRDDGNAGTVFMSTVSFTALLAAAFLVSGLLFSGALTRLLRADADIAEMTEIYLKVLLLFSPAFLMNDVFICFVRNDGNPRLSMIAMLGGSFSNILLDYIFLFPLKMGMFGAVLATGIAPAVSMLLLSLHFLQKKNGFHFTKARPKLAHLRSVVRLGFPSLVTEVSSGIVILVFNMILLRLAGTVGVAAYGVVANLSLVVISIFTGAAQGVQPLLSRAQGEGDSRKIKRTFRYGVVTVLTLSALIYFTVLLFAAPLTALFNKEGNEALQKMAVFGMRLYFAAAPFAGVNILVSSYFTSTAKAAPAHLLSLLRGFILIIPAAFALSAVMQVTGVWLAFPLTEAAVSVVGVIFYIRKGK